MEGSKDDVELESMLTDESLMLDIIYNASNSNGMGGSSSFTGSDPFFTGNMMSSAYGNGTGNIMSSSCLGASVPFPNPKDMYYKNTMNADFIQPGESVKINKIDRCRTSYFLRIINKYVRLNVLTS